MKKRCLPAFFMMLLPVLLIVSLSSCNKNKTDVPLLFKDAGVSYCVSEILGKDMEKAVSADAEDIVYLSITETDFSLGYKTEENDELYDTLKECPINFDIKNIDDISNFKNLRYIVLDNAFYLEDLSFLKGLSKLTHLYINMSSLASLEGIEEAVSLQSLTVNQSLLLDDFEKVDFGNLEKLVMVDLSRNLIEEYPDFSNCKTLTYLALDTNKISDISSLGGCKALNILTVSQNQITDLSAVSVLENLVLLYASENEISDVTPLIPLKNLEVLDLDGNQVTDVSPLVSCEKLKTLMIKDNPVTDLSPLENTEIGIISE